MNCLENQRTELILKFVSEKFHERAARNRNGLPVNLNASAESPTKDVTVTPFKRYLKASRLERDPSTKNRGTINNEFSLTPSTAKNETNSASTDQADAHSLGRPKSSMLQTQEKIDPRLRHGSREAHGSKTSEPRVSPPSTGHVAFTALFESVVYPAMKKSKKRHKDNLPREELDAIGKIVSLTSMQKWKKTCADHLDCQRCSEKISFSLRGFKPDRREFNKENQTLCKEVVSSKGQES